MVAKFRKKRKEDSQENLHSLIFSIFLVFLVVLMVGFLVYKNIQLYQHRNQLSSKIDSLREELLALEEKKKFLEGGLSEEERQIFIEEEARDKLNLQKEGEKAVAFILPEIGENEDEKQRSPWSPKNWWEWLKEKLRD